jgi:cytochrome c oxidase cbb3-type subunit III
VKFSLVISLAAVLAFVAAGCDREARRFDKEPLQPNAVAQADAWSEQQVGQRGRGIRAVAAAGRYDEHNAYSVAQGKLFYRWFNCIGCHAQGGGAIGPALMDANWLYGKDPDSIFATIMEGRPNGMPSFRGRIPEEQAWQIVAYVRSMSGIISEDGAPNRGDTLLGAPPENLRDPMRPNEKR